MRTATWMMCGGLLALTSACATQAAAGDELEPLTTTAAGVSVAAETTTTVPQALVDDCVAYVPFAAYTGNFYMQAIWTQANQDVAQLRAICEQISRDDPAGLVRMSEEHQAVTRYLDAASKATVVPAQCAPGSQLGADGYCAAQR